MVMQRSEDATPGRKRVRGFGITPAPAWISVVELGSLLRRLEDFRIVPVEDLRVVGVAYLPDALIAAVGIARTLGARNRRDQVLVQVFLEIDDVAGEDHRAGLRQLHGHELTAGGVAWRTHDAHRTIVEQIEVTVEADGVHFLGVGEIAGNVVDGEADIRPPGGLKLVVLGYERGVRKLADVASV